MKCTICGKEDNPSFFVSDVKESMEKHQVCFTCDFWRKLLEKDKALPPHTIAIIDGTHYYIEDEDDNSYFRGFGGARFQIEFKDGTKVITTNLWCQGKPEGYWKDKFPDNARFENNLKWKKIGECEYLTEEEIPDSIIAQAETNFGM